MNITFQFFPRVFSQSPLTHQMSYPQLVLLCGFCTPKGCSKFLTAFETMHLVFKNYVKKRDFENYIFFANLRMWAKKPEARNFLVKKFKKNWEFHEKVYAQLKPSQNNFHKRETQLCPIEFFLIFLWVFDPSNVRILTVRVLYTERMFKIFDPFWTMHLVFKNYVKKKTFWKLSFFCQSKNADKKAYNENFFDQKIQKNWEFHEKFYAQLKPSQNNFPKRETQLCLIEFFSNLLWVFDPSNVRILTVQVLYTESMFKIFDTLLNNAPGF